MSVHARFSGTPRFEVIRVLGVGGMGTVYEALDRERGERVAIKTVPLRDPELLLRLKREFRSLQDISSPHLVRYGELIEEGGEWLFTMEIIEGSSFIRYVRPSRLDLADPDSESPTSPMAVAVAPTDVTRVARDVVRCDERRLRSALVQLARGLSALHAHGMVHRDLKPANVLVSRDGRVVVVDLGLVYDSTAIVHSAVGIVAGTIAYMAPEQALGAEVGPAADWYAFGVMLYEALTGRVPLRGTSVEVIEQKQRRIPERPSALISSVPGDLELLCMALLEPRPADRPAGPAVLARLEAAATPVTRPDTGAARQVGPQVVPFVGREPELAALRVAFEDAGRGAPVVVMVRGESGVGKTALVRAFTEQILAEGPDTVILAGRCFERESVPYKALDSVIDALAGHLQRLPEIEAAGLRPRRASALLQVFPVLGRVPAIRDAPRVEIPDPQELRSRAFEALRELFERLCEGRRVVVLVDDFHWVDRDSLVLLAELLAPPHAPPLLCIGTWRTGGAAGDRRLDMAEGIGFREITLGPLDIEQATTLATTLLRLFEAPMAGRLAREAHGHPLFIRELARAAAAQDGHVAGATLDGVLWWRVQHLDEDARQIVEALSIGETPVRQETLATACGISRDALERASKMLRMDHLARAASERGAGFLDVYHARVREAVRGNLSSEDSIRWHGRLAAAFEAIEPDAHEALALHHLHAGQIGPAASHAVRAAERADCSLAFDQAARFYEMALSALPERAPGRSDLQERRGTALANAGRGFVAADAFRAAMDGADAPRALHCRWRVAEQLVKSGHIDEGLEETRAVLRSHRLPFPKSGLDTLSRLVLRRAEVAVRMRLPRSAPRPAPGDLERRVDICSSAGLMLAYIDGVRGALIQTRGLLLALQLGDRRRLARALLTEAGYVASGGARSVADSDRIYRMATALVVPGEDPIMDAWVPHMAGIIQYLQGRWTNAAIELRRAQAIIESACTDAAWDAAALSFILAQTLGYAGRLTEAARLISSSIRSGYERGDRYLTSMIRTGFQAIVWLAADSPATVRAHSQASIDAWSLHEFHMLHYNAAIGDANADLYEGQPQRAFDRIQGIWAAVRKAMFFEFEFCRIEMFEMRARAAIAAAVAGNDPRLLRLAASDIRRVGNERAGWAKALTQSLGAALAFAEKRRTDGVAQLREAARAFDAVEMQLHAASVRWVLGQIDPQAHARDREAAQVYFDTEGVRNPARMSAMLVPGALTD